MEKEITRTEYENIHLVTPELKLIESFSDPDGILSFGYGKPAMDTVYGISDGEESKPILRHEMRKESRYDKDWTYRYFQYIY
jgi:hypothetical protein